VPFEILDRHYKTGPKTDHRAQFHAGRPTRLEDPKRKKTKLEIWGRAQRESARRPMSDWEKIRRENFTISFSNFRHQRPVARTQMHWHAPNAHCRLRVGQHERL